MFNGDTQGHYAVIFTAQRTDNDEGYAEAVAQLRDRLKSMEGFLGMDAVEDAQGFEITISYWEDEAAIQRWANDPEHLRIRTENKERWYENFQVRVAKIERAYGGETKSDA